MAIKASTKAISDMKMTAQAAIKDINAVQNELVNTVNSVSGWNDEQGKQYRQLMRKIAQLTNTPKQTLSNAIPKLDHLIQMVEAYSKVKF